MHQPDRAAIASQGHMTMDPRIEAALRLFELDSIEVMREPKVHDTKMLLGCGRKAIVLAFRGTASAAGCSADIQVTLSVDTSWHFGLDCLALLG